MPTSSNGLGGRLPLTERSALSESQQQLWDRMTESVVPWAERVGFASRTDDGRFIGPFNPSLLSPITAGSFLDFQGAEEKNTSLSPRVRQVVILAVGAVWRSAYELYAHSAEGRKTGLSAEAVQALAAGQMPGREQGIGARVLTRLGAGRDRVRDRVADLLNQREQDGQEAQRARRSTPAELADTAGQLTQVRAQKEAALDAEDFEAAKALRDRGKELLAEKMRLERQLEAASEPPDTLQAVRAENQRLRRELDRLRGVLRDHGIDPDGGTAQPA